MKEGMSSRLDENGHYHVLFKPANLLDMKKGSEVIVQKKIQVIVATHKPYRMPTDAIYLPLHVGKAGKEDIGFQGDDTGDNISERNSNYNEMTGVYWAWKNLSADYIGLVHYRRHFAKKNWQCGRKGDPFSLIAERIDIERALEKHDVILAHKRLYYIETIESHFLHLPYIFPSDLETLKETIEALTPEYSEALSFMLHRRWAHMFNMFIMKRELFCQYCEWAFKIMDALNNRIDMTGRKPIEARFYISEFLLDTWIEKNHIDYGEMPVLFLEQEPYFKKCIMALKRKFSMT